MLETLRAWLNGTREYNAGVAIYSQVGTNEKLLDVLKKGPNDFRVKRLQEELLDICNQLKKENGTGTVLQSPQQTNENKVVEKGNRQENRVHPCNETLYAACKLEADQLYKKVMNDRAILFKLTECEKFEDPNLAHKVQDRVKLALDVVTGHQAVSQLYDKADFVKQHGHLPDTGEDPEEEYDHLPDHLVKLRLDNIRKAYNKLKKKEPNPERIALLQKHESNIEKLETKWLSLKPVT